MPYSPVGAPGTEGGRACQTKSEFLFFCSSFVPVVRMHEHEQTEGRAIGADTILRKKLSWDQMECVRRLVWYMVATSEPRENLTMLSFCYLFILVL